MPGGGRAFDALTRSKMERFNEETPDDPSVTYYSYGAQFRPSIVECVFADSGSWPLVWSKTCVVADQCAHLSLSSVFRLPWSIIFEKEGENDGLVSVESAKWGNYKVMNDRLD